MPEEEKIDQIIACLRRIRELESDSSFDLESTGLDTILQSVLRIEQNLIEKNEDLDRFIQHLQYCMESDFFSKFPVNYNNQELALISYGFNTYIEELESNVVSRDNFELIFNSITYHIFVFDDLDEIRFMNSSARQFYQTLSGYTITTIFEINSDAFVSKIIAFKQSQLRSEEFIHTWNAGEENPIYISYKLVKISFEGKHQVLIIGEDITSQKEEEVRMLRATFYGQDLERKRLAKDLHDSLGQELNAIKMHINASMGIAQRSTAYDDIIAFTTNIINDSINSIREVCFNLYPSHLEDKNIVTGILNLTERLKYIGPEFIVSSNHPVIIFSNKKDELFVYRIIQEFINNTLKYAEAQTVYIIIRYIKKSQLFHLKMLDDGKGFDMNTVKLNNGIHNIRQRLHALDASYEFTSTPGKGTELNFNLFQRKKS